MFRRTQDVCPGENANQSPDGWYSYKIIIVARATGSDLWLKLFQVVAQHCYQLLVTLHVYARAASVELDVGIFCDCCSFAVWEFCERDWHQAAY